MKDRKMKGSFHGLLLLKYDNITISEQKTSVLAPADKR